MWKFGNCCFPFDNNDYLNVHFRKALSAVEGQNDFNFSVG